MEILVLSETFWVFAPNLCFPFKEWLCVSVCVNAPLMTLTKLFLYTLYILLNVSLVGRHVCVLHSSGHLLTVLTLLMSLVFFLKVG